MSAPSVRAAAVRQLADTSRGLLDQAKDLLRRAETAQDGSEEKALLEAQASQAIENAKTIAQTAIKLGK